MTVQITIPSPGESISEVVLGPWHKHAGDWVEKDETLVEVESDKVTLEIPAPESGVLSVDATEGTEMQVGDVIGSIDPAAVPATASVSAPVSAVAATPLAAPSPTAASAVEVATETVSAKATSLARKVAADQGVDLTGVPGTGPSGRITRDDVIAAATTPTAPQPAAPMPASIATPIVAPAAASIVPAPVPGVRGVRREKMSRLRQRIAERLVNAQQTAAMLTTFNECDMTEVMRVRSAHKEQFTERYGVGLGFMSFFVKAATSALQAVPGVNAYIDGNEIEYHDYTDISVAVGTPKGLVVPVLRDTHLMSFANIESTIKDFALRARAGKLSIDEMTGGTFTISNGGVYGSLNSTPILNPPQSAILGMHTIQKRPVEDPQNPGQIALRPMMYLALSYDHRVVDGEQAVTFLAHIKKCLQHPERMLLGI